MNSPAGRRGFLSSLFSDTVYVLVGKVLGGASVVLLNFYLIRVLEPGQYGAYVFLTTALLLLDGMVCTSIDLAVMRVVTGREPQEGERQFAREEMAGVAVKLGVLAALLVMMLAAGERLGQLALHQANARWLMTTAVLAGGMQMLFRSVQLHYQIQLKFQLFGVAEFLHTLLRVSLILLCVWAGRAQVGWLISCYALAPFAMALLLTAAPKTGRFEFAGCTWQDIVRLSHTIRYTLATFGVGGVVSRLDVLILAFVGSAQELGVYGAAQSVIMIPEVLGTYLASVFTPRIMPLCKDGKFYSFFQRFYLAAYLGALMIFIVTAFAVRPLLELIFPASYSQSTGLVQWLLPGAIANFLLFPLTLNFMLFFSPRSFLFYDLCAAPVLGLAYYGAAVRYGVFGVAIVTLVSRLTKALVMQILATRLAFRVGSGIVPVPEREAFAEG